MADFLTVKEAAYRIGVDPSTIRRWISDGQLKAQKVGVKLLRINPVDLDALINPAPIKNTTEVTEPTEADNRQVDMLEFIDKHKKDESVTEPTVMLSTKEAAKELGIGLRYMQQLIKAGKIEAIRQGRIFKISPESIVEYQRERQTAVDAKNNT